MARLYSNENFPTPVVETLRSLRHDVLTSLEAGNANQSISDMDVLAYAIHESRILLTLNRKHFIRLHRETEGNHFGIIICTLDYDFPGQAQRIDEEISRLELTTGAIIRINRLNEYS